MTPATQFLSADASGTNVFDVLVQAMIVVGLIVSGYFTLRQIRKGKNSSDEPPTTPAISPPSSSEPALIMLINQNEARTKQLERDLANARKQRERDINEIATLKADLEDAKTENDRLLNEVTTLRTSLDTAIAKATQLADRLEYLEKLINGRTV